MKVFVINLDRNADRMAFMSRQLAKQGVAFERFSAVDGRALTQMERKRVYSHVRAVLNRGYGLRAGELGCTLSHTAICKRVVDEGLDFACILEDDAILAPEFATALGEVERKFDPSRKQVILLTAGMKELSDADAPEYRQLESAMFADAYILTRPAAAAILKANMPVSCMNDAWGRLRRRAGFELYRRLPTVAWQAFDDFKTDVRESLPSWRGTWRWKLWRAFGKTVDWLGWKLAGR